MDQPEGFHELQRQHMDQDILRKDRKTFHESWFKEDTVDFWRHKRMYETIMPLAKYYKDKEWVTIGDGRYGLDSIRLKKLFGIKVFPTDISKNMLEKAKGLGLVEEYGVENAEKLTFEDNSFDIVFCKESFHHFPRPMIALYEMIRVCKTAVILIEPNDYKTLQHPKILFCSLIKMMLNALFCRDKPIAEERRNWNYRGHSFEQSGNFVYTLSIRELEKVVHGINLEGLAYKGINDHYIKGCELEKAETNNEVFNKISNYIKNADRKCTKYPLFLDFKVITAVIFKEQINSELESEMIQTGFRLAQITKNPHVMGCQSNGS